MTSSYCDQHVITDTSNGDIPVIVISLALALLCAGALLEPTLGQMWERQRVLNCCRRSGDTECCRSQRKPGRRGKATGEGAFEISLKGGKDIEKAAEEEGTSQRTRVGKGLGQECACHDRGCGGR